jgi:uncharacterized membrane protein HdeD (DUF308 family)
VPGCMRAAQVTYTSIGSARLGIAGSPWGAVWLGGVLVLAGLFVLADVVAAKTASTILFALALLAAGTFEIVHAFRAPHWGALFLRLLLGLFYAISGGMLTAYPLASSNVLTIAFAAALIASGSCVFVWQVNIGKGTAACCWHRASSVSSPGLSSSANGQSVVCGHWASSSASTYCCTVSGGSCSA